MGRNVYMNNNINASLGRYGFGFVWAPMVLLLICTILFCIGGASGGDSYSGGRFGRSRSKRSSRGGMLNGDASR